MRNPLSKKVVEIQPSGIRKFFDIVSEMPDAISLGVGEPDFDTPAKISQELKRQLDMGYTHYTVGPGLLFQADYIIGGADGALSRGMGWQGMSFLTTLHYGPDMSITSTFMPTLPGKLFYLKELAGPLVAECN